MSADITAAVREQVLANTSLAPDFRPDAHLYHELGVSSVEAMQILLALEERHGITIPDEDFVEATTLDELAALVARIRS